MKKNQRQELIRHLIEQNHVRTQKQLLQLMTKRGVTVTQGTISNDLREMGVVKEKLADGTSTYVSAKGRQGQPRADIMDLILTITQVEFLCVIKTAPQDADLLGVLLDESSFPEVIGTLAGYDTVVVISQSRTAATHLIQRLQPAS
ncbi:arginine repressor [Ligilactobacillus hohenheimensis]|uniref:arginine repressor n=1 Tax=Ligilactobacillus hohenheimensis TaxID=2991832 RepID=UPI001FA67459|nr:ArgR family transcriptional regulator [Ligilactobacillus hohenheimensis]HJC04149.1 ArgR family transcriptional regulator [Candidatus Ligilactobacillus avistercoris]